MKKHNVMQLLLSIAMVYCLLACNDNPDWDSAKKGVEMSISTPKIVLDIQNSRLLGLLQEGKPIDPAKNGFNLHFLYGFGKNITVDIVTEGEGWGIVFKPVTLTFDPNDSGINWPGESEKGYVFIPIEEEKVEGRSMNGPLRNGTLPLIISVKNEEGEQIITYKTTAFVYDKDKTLKTIPEMNDDWKLSIGNAQLYTLATASSEVQNIQNKLIINAHFGSHLTKDFEGTGITASKVVKGTPVSAILQLDQYVAVDDVSGIFWQSAFTPFTDSSAGIAWAQLSGAAQMYDFATGNNIAETSGFKAYINGMNAKNVSNAQANNGSNWYTCVLDGQGDTRLIDVRTTTATWVIGSANPTTFDKVGTYILQWELLSKRPGSNPTLPLVVVGKLRVIVQVVDHI